MSDDSITRPPKKGRGATYNPAVRYHSTETQAVDDGWSTQEPQAPLRTSLTPDSARAVISYNQSPDIPFDRAINPFRGCEHGCIYCYARPSHAWLGLSPGLDFESRLFYKPEAASLLRAELGKSGYRPAPIALGSNTDAYQPAERELRITRSIIEVLAETRHPLTLITKSALVERDLDLLAPMAEAGLVRVAVSFSTADAELARSLEPRASSPLRRLKTLETLAQAGIPVGTLIAPVIPALTDTETENLLSLARNAGASFADYVLLRLPLEVAPLFREWLDAHRPDRAAHVMSSIRDTRRGHDNDARFDVRMRGEGPIAAIIAQRFALAHKRLGFCDPVPLRCDLFRPPSPNPGQLDLF